LSALKPDTNNHGFKCPNGIGAAKKSAPSKVPFCDAPQIARKAPASAKGKDDKLTFVVANLKQRGNSKPRSLKTLKSAVASLYPKGLPEGELTLLLEQLRSSGKVIVNENKVTYML
jgi:hypothetical protein